MSGGRPSKGERQLRFHVTGDLYEAWCALEDEYRKSGLPWSFVGFACAAVWETWAPTMETEVAYAHIYARDLQRCSSPVCTRRDLTPHHLKFRAHGGGDEDQNVASLCVHCHLRGIHEGRLRARPPASRIRWEIGREPILFVDGREARKDVMAPAHGTGGRGASWRGSASR